MRGEPHQGIDLPACSWTGLLPRRQWVRSAQPMQGRSCASWGIEGAAVGPCAPPAWALQLGLLQKRSLRTETKPGSKLPGC